MDVSVEQQRASCLHLLAHDLNNPLTAIRILAEMLRDELPGEEMRRDMIDVLEAADLAGALVEGMASMVRLEGTDEDYTWFPIDLVDVICQAVDRPALRRYVRVRLPRAIQISGDRAALARAFTDLLVNARRLVEPGTSVEVSGGETPRGIEIVVFHPGLGVPGPLRESLFTLFGAVELRREHRIPVTAVGLAHTDHVIRRHGGALRVEDAVGGGMNIIVRLPR